MAPPARDARIEHTAAVVEGMAPGDLGRHKTLSAMTYVVGAGARARARRGRALLVNARGRVLSAAGSNVFAHFGPRAVDPAAHAPDPAGTTRERVFLWFPDVREVEFTAVDLRRADEVFLTNAVRGVVPIVTLDGRPVATASPGRNARGATGV